MKQFLSKYLFFYVFSVCATLFFTGEILRIGAVTAPTVSLLSAAAFSALFVVLYEFRKKIATYIAILSVTIATAVVMMITNFRYLTQIYKAFGTFSMRGELTAFGRIAVVLCISFLVSLVIFAISRFFVMRTLTAVLILGVLVILAFSRVNPDAVTLFGGVCVIFTLLAEISIRELYHGKGKFDAVMSFIVPITLAFALITAALPTSEEPIKWTWVKEAISSIRIVAENTFAEIKLLRFPGASEFGISMQGYSDTDSVLGGNLVPSDAQAMVVEYTSTPKSDIYLVGTVNNIYDGHKWSKSEYPTFSEDEYILDSEEILAAFAREGYSEDTLNSFTKRTTLRIRYDRVKTKTVFYPLKTTSLDINEGYRYVSTSPSISFKRVRGESTLYSLRYLEVDYKSGYLTDIARKGYTYKDSDGCYKERAAYIKDNYTELPDCISERTYALADEICAGCDTDYDKLCAIESYLRGMEYTYSPGNVPEGREPVDYFIFESKRGYCTYFATSMAVLARCEGIPTRYVQGFCVDKSDRAEKSGYSVKNINAHAWTEAYIEGVGWIPFEPTSSFEGRRYGNWEDKFVPNNFGYEEREHSEESSASADIERDDVSKEKTDRHIFVFIAVGAFFATIVGVFAAVAIKLGILKKRYGKSVGNDKFVLIFRLITALLESKRIVRENGETLKEFAERTAHIYRTEEVDYYDIIRSFETIRYGEMTVSDKELAVAEKYLEYLNGEIKSACGKTKYLMIFLKFRT